MVLDSFAPLFIKGPGYWTYYLMEPVTLPVTCSTNPVSKSVIKLASKTRQGCSAHDPTLKIPAHDTVVDGLPVSIARSPFPFPSPWN